MKATDGAQFNINSLQNVKSNGKLKWAETLCGDIIKLGHTQIEIILASAQWTLKKVADQKIPQLPPELASEPHTAYCNTHIQQVPFSVSAGEETGCTESKQIHEGTICIIQKATQVLLPSMCVLQNEKSIAYSKACVCFSDKGLCLCTTAVYSVPLSTLRFHSTPYDTHCLCSHPVYYKERISQTVPPLAQTCLYLADSPPSRP